LTEAKTEITSDFGWFSVGLHETKMQFIESISVKVLSYATYYRLKVCVSGDENKVVSIFIFI